MSAGDLVNVYVAVVRNTSIARYSDDYFQQYTYRTDDWIAMQQFMNEALFTHPGADIDLTIQRMYHRELDSLPRHSTHNPSNKQLTEVDR